MRSALLSLVTVLACCSPAFGLDWIRPGISTNQPVWGLRGGLLFAVAPGGFRGGEPRGLIRLGSPVLPGGAYELVNFIAIEPVVRGRKGFSELERSGLDRVQGKRIWATAPTVTDRSATNSTSGILSSPATGVEQLEVTLRVEAFDNGAHVWLRVRQRSDRPDEIELAIHAEPDCASMDFCILTATMGNMMRTRLLWLRDRVESSLRLYPDYRDKAFATHSAYPLPLLQRTPAGDVIAAVTNDEEDPGSVFPFAGTRHWHYGGAKVTQYWMSPKGDFSDALQAVVNARFTYWQSAQVIPGGIAFENFELRDRFRDGQRFVFGITRKTPQQLGFNSLHFPALNSAAPGWPPASR